MGGGTAIGGGGPGGGGGAGGPAMGAGTAAGGGATESIAGRPAETGPPGTAPTTTWSFRIWVDSHVL